MTDVHFSWKQLDGIVNPYKSTTGVVTITPLRYSHEDNTLITDASVSKRVDGDYTFKLPPNSPGTFYQFKLAPNEGSTVIEYRLVPDGTSFEYVDLALVDGEANYVDDSSVPPWIAELEELKESGDFFVSKVEAALDVAGRHAANAEASADAAKSSATNAGSIATSAEASADAAKSSATNAGSSATSAKAAAEQARDAATMSQESALSVMPMLSGSVTITPQGGTLSVDLGQAVNTVTGMAGTSGAVDVTFPDVTTPDGRVNPDGLGTLLRVDAGAERLTWPGGTVVHGTPPEGKSALASLVRVGGSVTVVWPPEVVTSTAPGVTAQIAEIEQIIGGEVEVQPGGTVLRDIYSGNNMPPAMFVNPYSDPTNRGLVLTVGKIDQSLWAGESFQAYVAHRPGGLKDYSIWAAPALDPDGGPVKKNDGWLLALAPGPAFGNVYVGAALRDIQSRVATSSLERFTDGTWGVVLQYDASNPRWEVSEWGGVVNLFYSETGDTTGWEHGMVLVSGLALPMAARESDYASLGITLPGTFHRAAELEAMGVYIG